MPIQRSNRRNRLTEYTLTEFEIMGDKKARPQRMPISTFFAKLFKISIDKLFEPDIQICRL